MTMTDIASSVAGSSSYAGSACNDLSCFARTPIIIPAIDSFPWTVFGKAFDETVFPNRRKRPSLEAVPLNSKTARKYTDKAPGRYTPPLENRSAKNNRATKAHRSSIMRQKKNWKCPPVLICHEIDLMAQIAFDDYDRNTYAYIRPCESLVQTRWTWMSVLRHWLTSWRRLYALMYCVTSWRWMSVLSHLLASWCWMYALMVLVELKSGFF